MSRDSFFVPGAEGSRFRVCLWGMGLSPGMSHAAASIRKSGLEIKNRCTDCPCFDLFAAAIRKSGLEIENRCTDCPCFDLFAASIRKSGLEIENRCTPSCRRVEWPACAGVVATVPRPILIFVVSKKKGSPAAVVAATMPCQIQIFVVSKKSSSACSSRSRIGARPILIFVVSKKSSSACGRLLSQY